MNKQIILPLVHVCGVINGMPTCISTIIRVHARIVTVILLLVAGWSGHTQLSMLHAEKQECLVHITIIWYGYGKLNS